MSLRRLLFGLYERQVKYGVQTIEIFFGIDRQPAKASAAHRLSANDDGGRDFNACSFKVRLAELAGRGQPWTVVRVRLTLPSVKADSNSTHKHSRKAGAQGSSSPAPPTRCPVKSSGRCPEKESTGKLKLLFRLRCRCFPFENVDARRECLDSRELRSEERFQSLESRVNFLLELKLFQFLIGHEMLLFPGCPR